jgi:chaperone required for assembly of F1-ATPase
MPDVTQTIECTGDLVVSGTSATCSVEFQLVQGLISADQTSNLIAAIAVCVALMAVFKIILKLMES